MLDGVDTAGGGCYTLELWRVRWRTVMVWSWAVTSFKFLGRLSLNQYNRGTFSNL